MSFVHKQILDIYAFSHPIDGKFSFASIQLRLFCSIREGFNNNMLKYGL